jgi:hypothetical protein
VKNAEREPEGLAGYLLFEEECEGNLDGDEQEDGDSGVYPV